MKQTNSNIGSGNSVKVYSVIVTHEAEAHENFLYTDREKAIAKMEEIKNSWVHDNVTIHKYKEDFDYTGMFTPQYATKLGYWYENAGDARCGLWEYGYVEMLECTLEL